MYFVKIDNENIFSWNFKEDPFLLDNIIDSTFILYILKEIFNKPKNIRWIYFNNIGLYEKKEYEKFRKIQPKYIINHTKKTYINIEYLYESNEEKYIFPLFILCNEFKKPTKQDFYNFDDPRRRYWFGDLIESSNKINDYIDMTEQYKFMQNKLLIEDEF